MDGIAFPPLLSSETLDLKNFPVWIKHLFFFRDKLFVTVWKINYPRVASGETARLIAWWQLRLRSQPSGNHFYHQVTRFARIRNFWIGLCALKYEVNSKVVWWLSSLHLALKSIWFPGRLLQLIQEIIALLFVTKEARIAISF